ncbi:MAG: hypothetical protein V3R99_01185 [Thermoguttaceae bacterium]
MSTLWIAVAVLAVTPPQGEASPVTVSSAIAAENVCLVSFRTGIELRDAAREALRRWAKVGDKEATLAAGEFLVLYRELQADTQMALALREPLRGKLRSRLLGLTTQIKTRAAVERRLARDKKPGSVDAAKQREVLGQFGFSGQTDWPGAMRGAFGGAAGVNDDYGEDLIELIQMTISPKTWDINGGPGAIYYWRPGRALVVTAPGEIHDQIGDVLELLGKAGR